MDKKTEFVFAAIADTQATIRAIDVKVAAILVAVLAPLQNLHRVFAHLNNFCASMPGYVCKILAILFVIMWIFAVAALIRAIGAIDNPANHIINNSNLKGTFFSGGLYKLGVVDVFLNRDVVKASKDPVTFSANLPANAGEIEQELVFEQMKLVYIRDMKIKRLHWGLIFSQVWFVLGLSIYVISKYKLIA